MLAGSLITARSTLGNRPQTSTARLLEMLLTTTQGFWYVDAANQKAHLIDHGNGVYYGIAYSSDTVFVAARRAEYGSDRAVQNGVVLCYDRRLNLVDTLKPSFPLRDLHQIAWFDDRLWVCCTYDDMVAVWDGKSWEKWFPLGHPATSDERNRFHLNSVFATGNQVVLVGNKAKSGTLYQFQRDSLAEFDRTALGAGSHNVWAEGDSLFTLSSATGEICSTSGLRHYVGNYVRGAVITPRARLIGISETNPRHLRSQSNCSIFKFDDHWRIDGISSLMNQGMVHDLRAPQFNDLAHETDVAIKLEPACWERFPEQALVPRRVFPRPFAQRVSSFKKSLLGFVAGGRQIRKAA